MQKQTTWRWARHSAAALLTPLLAFPAAAQSHVVTPSELTQAAAAATQSREQKEDSVKAMFESQKVQESLKQAGIDPSRVITAVAQLNEAELTKLAARAQQAQADFAAGDLSERDLLWILIGIAALILIIVAVR